MNNLSLIGRLTKDPELRYTNSGIAVCRFTLAVDKVLSKDKKMEAENKGQPTADFIGITAFGKTAELVSSYITKGQQLAVTGRIRTNSYDDKDGKRVFRTDVIADRVYFISNSNGNSNNNNNNNGANKEETPNYDDFGLGGDAFPLTDDDIPF